MKTVLGFANSNFYMLVIQTSDVYFTFDKSSSLVTNKMTLNTKVISIIYTHVFPQEMYICF